MLNNFSKKLARKVISLLVSSNRTYAVTKTSAPQPLFIESPNNKCINFELFLNKNLYLAKPNTTKKVAIFCNVEDFKSSAITKFSLKTFLNHKDKFHIFTAVKSQNKITEAFSLIDDLDKSCIFNAECYEDFNYIENYAGNIFILGDSEYNVPTFNQLLKMVKYRNKNYLYLHDGMNIGLLWHALSNEKKYDWLKVISSFYPEYQIVDGVDYFSLVKNNIYFNRPIFELTGIKNVFTNTKTSREIILSDLKHNNINVLQAFLPITNFSNINAVSLAQGDELLIGHFGMLNEYKGIEKLIEAVAYLNDILQQDAKLLLAGFGITEYLKSTNYFNTPSIIIAESPDDDEMYSLIKGTDVCVQMRWPIFGQSSGVITEAIGCGKKVITTKGFVDDRFSDVVVEVAHDVSAAELAKTILRHKEDMNLTPKQHTDFIKNYSFDAAANFFHASIVNKNSTSSTAL